MSYLEIDREVLSRVIAGLGQQFHTKDVSEDDGVRDVHTDLTSHDQFHAFVGKALMLHHIALGIEKTGEHSARGSEWTKQT